MEAKKKVAEVQKQNDENKKKSKLKKQNNKLPSAVEKENKPSIVNVDDNHYQQLLEMCVKLGIAKEEYKDFNKPLDFKKLIKLDIGFTNKVYEQCYQAAIGTVHFGLV